MNIKCVKDAYLDNGITHCFVKGKTYEAAYPNSYSSLPDSIYLYARSECSNCLAISLQFFKEHFDYKRWMVD